ncbi:MAG TPA: FAD-dependent oxidoreductase [Thermotogota bacterium]|nr:FAD-dependent oxidoreductase [Thermotogota bacterium]
MKYDCVVFGGGMAGFHCAIAAARMGKKVLLVEQTGTLGGMATNGLVNPFMRYWLNDEHLVQGLFSELLSRVDYLGGLYANTFDSELIRLSLHDMAEEESNLSCLFNAQPIACHIEEGDIKSSTIMTGLSERIDVESDQWVDATGNASFAYLSGAQTESGDEQGNNQALTTMFIISGVNFSRIKADVKQNRENFLAWVNPEMELISCAGYFEEIERAKKAGLEYPNTHFFFVQLPGKGRVTVNTTHIFAQTTNSFELSRAIHTGHKQALKVFQFAKEYVSGFENAYLEKIAPQIGIRESRRVKGLYTFTGHDVVNANKFDDGVVKACYGIDIHKGKAELTAEDKQFIPNYQDYYEIPLRSLVSIDFNNLFMAGRCLSSDFSGQSAARIMPTCAGMGQSLGVFLALNNHSIEGFNKEIINQQLQKITHQIPKG